MKEKKTLGFTKILLMFGLIPLTTAVLCLGMYSYFSMSKNLDTETYQMLKAAATQLSEHYSNVGISEEKDYTYVDSLIEEDIELTVFNENVRWLTSIKDSNGRIEGTHAAADIYEEVNAGNTYTDKGVKINNGKYYVCYVPIYDGTEVVGMAFAGKVDSDVSSYRRSMAFGTLFVGLAVTLLFVVIIVLVSIVVKRPLKELADATNSLADGDITNKVNVHSIATETVNIINAYNKLFDSLKKIVSEIRRNCYNIGEDVDSVSTEMDSVNSSIQQVTITMQELATAATTMACNVEAINNNVTTIDDEVSSMSRAAKDLSANSYNMKVHTEDASEAVNTALKNNEEATKVTSEISAQLIESNKSVQGIKEVLSMISDVADQTKLLSLNANIEAARAGDAGKGFAVVASEIQRLSEQSQDGVVRIRELADEMLLQSDNSVKLSNQVSDKMIEESESLKNVSNKFERLAELIESVVSGVGVVSNSTQSVDKVKNSIVSSVQELSALSQENAASNEEVSASMEVISQSVLSVKEKIDDVSGISEELRESVAVFK